MQASQLSLNASGIGTFSDRARDAVRGGSATDSAHLRADQGWINGEFYDPNDVARQTYEALEADKSEILADPQTRGVKASLSADVPSYINPSQSF